MNSKYWILTLVGWFIWMFGSYTGGFSETPQSDFEGYTDGIGVMLMFWGIMADVLKGVVIHKNNVMKVDEMDLIEWMKKYE